MWFDFSFPGKYGKSRADWDSGNLLKLARSLQPGIIVDDRLDLKDVEGGWDFTTPESEKVLKWPEINEKKWMKFNSRSIYGCTEAPAGFITPANSLLTYNPVTERLYVHLLVYPMNSLTLTDMADKVKYVQFLHDASEVQLSTGKDDHQNEITLHLPVLKPQTEIPVLEIYLK